MAIIENKQNLGAAKIVDVANNPTPKKEDEVGSNNSTKRQSFIASTVQELRKVNWPSAGYVAKWSVIIIIFTFVFSIILGSFDHIFSTSINFVNCSSPEGLSRSVGECGQDFLRELTFADN